MKRIWNLFGPGSGMEKIRIRDKHPRIRNTDQIFDYGYRMVKDGDK